MIDLSMGLKQKLRIINSLRTIKENNPNWKKDTLVRTRVFFYCGGRIARIVPVRNYIIPGAAHFVKRKIAQK